MDRDIVMAYSDGSCNNKTHQKGGYGVVLKWKGKVKEISGGRYDETTSARMEILGAIKALECIKPKFRVILHSDSEYVVNAFNKGWLFNWALTDFGFCKNPDLWRYFLALYRTFPEGYVKFVWVRGHNGHPENERCDQLASKGGSSENIVIDNHNLFEYVQT